MLYETLRQGVVFLFLFYFGLLGGILYEWSMMLKSPIKNKAIHIVFDVVFCALLFVVFFFAVQSANYGEIRAFLVISFFFGFFVERITIGFWLAKLTKLLYNKVVKLIKPLKKLKVKLKGKRQNESIHAKTSG
jgi:hypothetical protein